MASTTTPGPNSTVPLTFFGPRETGIAWGARRSDNTRVQTMTLGEGPEVRRKRMRKTVMMLGVAMLLVVVAAGTALAVTKTCNSDPCSGSDNDDVLYERADNRLDDTIYGMNGSDDIDANTFRRDEDRLFGGSGSDRLLTNDDDGRDTIRGGDGRDVCFVDPGDRVTGCESVRGENQRTSTGDLDFDRPASAF